MPIHARPFEDPRNAVLVDNNDPNAADRRFAGMPGTHVEYRCCENRPPSRLPQETGWYLDHTGQRICKIVEYWNRPENRAGARYGWWNAETPRGYFIETALTGRLMCNGCFGSVWDQFLDDLSTTFDQLVPVIRGLAMVISYIPVLGTGVSFLLNAAVTLAQGGSLENAVLDGVGGALPGQPASGAAFNAARSLVRGDRVDQVAIAALPVDNSVKEALSVAMDIAIRLAQRQDIGDVALDQLYGRLPEEGRRAVDLARRAARGEPVENEFLRLGIETARARGGEEAVRRYIAESGFQGTVDTLDPDLQIALRLGLVVGSAEQHQYIGPLFDPAEQHSDALNRHAGRGREIIDAGAFWFGRTVSAIRSSSAFTFTRDLVDPFTNVLRPHTVRHELSDRWRRGFDVAWGLCEGKAEDDQEQQTVRGWLGHPYAAQGFDVGQAMQHYRTWAVIRGEADSDALRRVQMAPRPAPDEIRGTADRDVLDRIERALDRGGTPIEGTAGGPGRRLDGLQRRMPTEGQPIEGQPIEGVARNDVLAHVQPHDDGGRELRDRADPVIELDPQMLDPAAPFLYRDGRFR